MGKKSGKGNLFARDLTHGKDPKTIIMLISLSPFADSRYVFSLCLVPFDPLLLQPWFKHRHGSSFLQI